MLKGSYGRYYNNFSYGLASAANPGYSNGAGFTWQDLDGNNILTREESIGRQELGEMIYDWGGGSTVIDTSAPLPYSDQYQISLEHQFRGESAMRIIYVHKTRDRLGLADDTVNLAQVPFISIPFQVEDPGAPGQMLNLMTTPHEHYGSNNVMGEYPDSNHWAYDTITTNIRIQNGWPYARRVDIPIYAGTGVDGPNAGPSLGTKPVFVEDIKNNRSETVPLWDFRIDKRFDLGNAGSDHGGHLQPPEQQRGDQLQPQNGELRRYHRNPPTAYDEDGLRWTNH